MLAKFAQQEEQLSSCMSSAREVKPVDKPSQIWSGKKSKMEKKPENVRKSHNVISLTEILF